MLGRGKEGKVKEGLMNSFSRVSRSEGGGIQMRGRRRSKEGGRVMVGNVRVEVEDDGKGVIKEGSFT